MSMTTEEAGRRGGNALKKKLGKEAKDFYSRIGKLGGSKTKKTLGADFYSKIGEKGGAVVSKKFGKDFYSKIGKKGGRRRSENLYKENSV